MAVAAALLVGVPVMPPFSAPPAQAATTQFVDVSPDDEGPIPGQPLPPHGVGIIDCPNPCIAGHDGGRVNGLSSVPGDPNTYFAASELGGLFKFDLTQNRWSHLDGYLPTRAWDVAAASGGQTVYATSFYDGRTESLAGLQVSKDGGSTWTHPTLTAPAGCDPAKAAQASAFGIALRPGTAEALVGTNCGIARSTDGGTTWVQFDPTNDGVDPPNRVWDLVALPGGQTYACGDDGLLSSPDGQTWTSPANNKPDPALANPPYMSPPMEVGGFCSLAVSPDEPDVVVAMFGNAGFGEIFVTDGGRYFEGEVTFTAGTATGVSWSAIPHPDVAPPNANITIKGRVPFVVTNDRSAVDAGAGPQPGFDLWMGTGNLVRVPCVTGNVPRCTTDATKWSPQPNGTYTDRNGQLGTTEVHGDMGDVEFDPTQSIDACPTLISSDGGVYRQVKTTSDCHSDAAFASANAGLHAFMLWGMTGANQTGDAEHLYIGTQDNGFYSSEDGGTTWMHRAGADVFDVVADPSSFAVTAEGAVLTGQPGVTTMKVAIPNTVWNAGMGATFRLPDPIDQAGGEYWIASRGFAGPPAVPRGALHTSNLDNFMADVAANPAALTLGSWPATANLPCAIQVAESMGVVQPYVQAGACTSRNADQLWTFDFALNDWRQLTVPATAPGAGFSMFGLDPANPQRLYAAVVGDGDPRMVRSTNGGLSWELPDAELTELMHGRGAFVPRPQLVDGVAPFPQPTMVAFDPQDADIIVAGGWESGVFISSDGGESWALLTDPFGRSNIPHLPRPFFAHFDHDAAGIRVYIGSVGRGVWRIELATADLSVAKADAPDPVSAGGDVTYTVRVTNGGPDVALHPVMEDVLPAGTTFRSVQAPAGWSCETPAVGAGGTVRCEAEEMGPGSVTFTMGVRVSAGLPGGTVLSDTARVVSAAVDPDPSNNRVTEDTEVRSLGGGGARVEADFDTDGFADLAIGIRGEDVGTVTDAGAVAVLYGSASGLSSSGDQVFSQDAPGVDDTAEAGDAFGSALAAGDFNGDGFADLAVGIPGEDMGTVTDAGAVAVLYGTASGLGAAGSQVFTQGTPGPDAAEAGDAYGSALAAGDFNGDAAELLSVSLGPLRRVVRVAGGDDLAVGIPSEDVGTVTDAGAVAILYGSRDRLSAAGGQFFTQDTPGVDDTAEASDAFGSTVAAGDFNDEDGGGADLAVGVPGEDVGTVTDAGAVAVLYGTASGLTDVADQVFSQETTGLSDTAEAGDAFGSALAAGDFDDDGGGDLAIGIPGEDVGTVTDAGAVAVLYGSDDGSGLSDSGDQFFTQDTPGVDDTAEAGDAFGSALAAGDFDDDDGGGDLAIGIPGEDVGSVVDAGAVAVLQRNSDGLSASGNQFVTQDTAGVKDTAEAGDAFGSALTSL